MAYKLPRQARSIATVEAILEAAARILTNESYKSFTTNRVAEVAGISIGSLYQYFGSKESILHELIRLHANKMIDRLEQILSEKFPESLKQIIVRLVDANINLHKNYPALDLVLANKIPQLDDETLRNESILTITNLLVKILSRYREEILIENLFLAALNIFVIARTLIHTGMTELKHHYKGSTLTDEVSRTVYLYLTSKA